MCILLLSLNKFKNLLMNQASLFQSQRSFSVFLGTAGILLLFSTLFFLNNHVLADVAAPLIMNPVFIHLNSRKYHFSYDKEHICWHFPNSECEKSVKLSDPSYHIHHQETTYGLRKTLGLKSLLFQN